MAPFTIHCTTCHAALRVTNAAAIGQILACPKCGSMVQVTPPTPVASADSTSVAVAASGASAIVGATTAAASFAGQPRSSAVFTTDIERLAEEAASLLPGGSGSSVVRKAVPVARPVVAAPTQTVAPTPTPTVAPTPTPTVAPTPAANAANAATAQMGDAISRPVAIQSPPPIPAAAAQSVAVQPAAANVAVAPVITVSEAAQAAGGKGWWVGVTAALAAAVSLMAVAWGVWDYLQIEKLEPAVAQATSEEEIVPVAVDEPDHEKNSVVAPSIQAQDQAAATPPPDQNVQESNREPSTAAAEVRDVAGAEKQQTAPPQAKAANEGIVAAEAMPAAPAPGQETDHTAGKPTIELSEEPKTEAAKVAAEADGAFALPDLPAAVGDAAEQQEPLVKPVVKEEANPPTAEEAAPIEPPLERIAPAKIDVNAQLAQKMPAIEVNDLPLYRFVELASQWANVPLTIDVDGLQCRGIEVDAPIRVTKRAANLGAAIDAALAPYQLKLVAADGHAIVMPADEGKTRKARYVVGDLVRPGDPAITALAETVRGVLGFPAEEEKEGPRLEVATDTFYLTATDETHDRMIELCEKLRVARGRPLRTKYDAARPDARFDPRRFELSTRTAKAKAMLSRRVTAGIGTAAPLSEVVEYLSQRSGAVLLIDARALVEAELSLHTECRLHVDDEPLAAALGRLLAPLELTYRVIDGKTIQITTPAAAAERPDLEMYSVRGLIGGDEVGALVARLEQRLIEAAGKEGLELAYDPPSQALIVTAPTAVQAKVEEALGKLGAVEAAAGEKVSGIVR